MLIVVMYDHHQHYKQIKLYISKALTFHRQTCFFPIVSGLTGSQLSVIDDGVIVDDTGLQACKTPEFGTGLWINEAHIYVYIIVPHFLKRDIVSI